MNNTQCDTCKNSFTASSIDKNQQKYYHYCSKRACFVYKNFVEWGTIIAGYTEEEDPIYYNDRIAQISECPYFQKSEHPQRIRELLK